MYEVNIFYVMIGLLLVSGLLTVLTKAPAEEPEWAGMHLKRRKKGKKKRQMQETLLMDDATEVFRPDSLASGSAPEGQAPHSRVTG